MINTYRNPESTIPQGLGPNPSVQAGELRMAELRAEAAMARLVTEYRRSHPELGIRYRTARALRSLADRIAPPTCAPNPRARVVRT